MANWIHQLHQIVWGPWMLILFLGTGLYLTVRSGGFQIRGIGLWMKHTAGSLLVREKATIGAGKISQIQTACTALAATIGTGNIVGVATALTAGGPGAVFWMWVSAMIGMMTAYGETWLGICHRVQNQEGKWLCGPMVTLKKGAGLPFLAGVYGLFCVLASLGMGSMVQANSLAEAAEFAWGIPRWSCGIILVLLAGVVIKGGTKRIAGTAGRLIPWSAAIYLTASLAVLCLCWRQIPVVLGQIISAAFCPEGAARNLAGGAAGWGMKTAVQYGVARGVFSNEAGLGSLAILHGTAEDGRPEIQGMWAIFEVFFDTILVCSVTALVILCAAAQKGFPLENGAALAVQSFSECLGKLGEYTVALSMMLFAFATIIAWYYMGRQAAEYMVGGGKWASVCFLIAYLSASFWGCIVRLETVWELADIVNGLMAIPNLAAILLLADQIHYPTEKKRIQSGSEKRKAIGR